MTDRKSTQPPHPRILVVEDDPEMLDLLMDELSDEGYQVTRAVNGSDALYKVSREEYDAVITDLKMPEVGGMEMLPDLKKACPNTPVIVITAFGDWPTLIEAYEEGICEFMTKPFKMLDLKKALKKALEGK
jgi:two-component system, NtrC family, response regulator GlrR